MSLESMVRMVQGKTAVVFLPLEAFICISMKGESIPQHTKGIFNAIDQVEKIILR